ncbi:MAG: transcription termination/antitermination NusG family protein [Verrucomicrobiota bacterium]|jgi:transcriptional antiterminator RfaH|nr:transcription termination/antitermination NusG family protein [Verrucomicrobiota bacterium]MEC7542349.1 transcription termination/antitermination NusG family protein [Verrucomicrobiota bacterium]MEC7627941.1 transcription termination/antitermination NusG family protein [Verrucomicrobiota bacterium]MEC8655251.1 transcription termination/antitermination NusG family protein [Verrucomicrobiota bacterium]MEC8790453.1 transcription termination/antitermination NusG family protein [Verrucomicrobiota|tara:strand:+ start:1443 stop:1985 length:543 start_codon:yes stop_codon:yes gene_type:complete
MKHSDEKGDWSMGWYCVRAKPRMETVAAATLQTLKSVEVFLPRTVRPKKIKCSPIKPLFPGYFFARFDPIVHLRNVHFARGVSYVVRRKEIPVPVSPQVMLELRLISPDGILEIPDKPHRIGDKVKAIAGLFEGEQGDVTQLIPSRERIKVLFEILGRPTEVEIDENFLDFPSTHPMGTS